MRLLLVIFALASTTAGQTLTVHPSPPTSPALRYELLRIPARSHEGNAAIEYFRAASAQASVEEAEDAALLELVDLPLDELRDPAKLARVEAALGGALDNLRRAERASHCDWQVVMSDGIGVTLPELSQLRRVARLVGIRARILAAGGRYDEALASIALLIRMGHDLGDGTTLIQALVGIAVVQLALERVQELIQQPGAPNLYWALTDLPSVPVDLRRALRFERHFFDFEFPELQAVIDGTVPARDAPRVVEEIERKLRHLVSVPGEPALGGAAWNLAAMAISTYPKAKAQLIARGMTEEEVEALPVAYVALRHTLVRYMELRDEQFRWFGLPTHQAFEGLARSEHQFEAAMAGRDGYPFTLLLPALHRSMEAAAVQERYLAALRLAEALRLHAHERGSLPSDLLQVTAAPIPFNPMTGAPFAYELSGGEAIITGASPPGTRKPSLELRIRIAKP